MDSEGEEGAAGLLIAHQFGDVDGRLRGVTEIEVEAVTVVAAQRSRARAAIDAIFRMLAALLDVAEGPT